jgi:peptidoglycan/xylan/chitin deacetylase (PgdA/CDA1 family)
MTHATDRRRMAFGACCIAILLAVASCATPTASTSSPSPAPATTGVPVATATISTPTISPSPTVEITPTPSPSPPPADQLPLVNSCDPTSVPGAVPVAPASGAVSSFTLNVPILMYHRIVPVALAGDSIPDLVVPPQTFAAQLDALDAEGWHTITMATLANDLQARIKPPSKTFVITIDDGWDDGYTYALPILQQHGFVATYFVIASRIDVSSFLSSAHLRALVAAGDEIGDHTMDHVNLTAQSPAKLTYEIDAAAARIAQVTGYWPESLAYPSGHEDSRVLAAVAACQGLRIAVIEGHLVVQGPAAPQQSGASPAPAPTAMLQAYETWAFRFVIPRIRVTPGTTPAALLAMLG